MKRCLAALFLTLSMLASAPAETSQTPLILLKRENFENMMWSEERTNMGKESVMGCIEGLGAAGDSIMVYELKGEFDLLDSFIGYKKGSPSGRSCVFEVTADGRTLFTSDSIKSGAEPEHIKVPIKGANIMVLRIRPDGYGATAGAAWGGSMLMKGLKPEDLVQPLSVDINGAKSQMLQPGGITPKELMVNVPLKPGENSYRVHVTFDKATNKVQVTTEPATP